MANGTVPPVVGRRFKMRNGSTARVEDFWDDGSTFAFGGTDDSGADAVMSRRADGTWGLAREESPYDLVEMLPRRWRKIAAWVLLSAAAIAGVLVSCN